MRLPEALRVVRGYVDRLRDGRVDTDDLLITKQLSKNPAEYQHNVVQVIAAKQLIQDGVRISAGQNVSYIIQRRNSEKCVLPRELIEGPIQYDVERYTQLLLNAATALLSPLGRDELLRNELHTMSCIN
jgi:DNA polymerase elongation subunit (family B)